MPKLSAEDQAIRVARILDAAERCFARGGFHGTTIQHICAEAGISAGALYTYFDGKESLIRGICERERAEAAKSFEALADAPDVMAAFEAMVLHYFRDEPAYKRQMVVEVGVEAARNPEIAQIFKVADTEIHALFVRLFDRLIAEDRIRPERTSAELADAMMVMGDGLFWRRAVHADFDAEQIAPLMLAMIEALIRPRTDLSEGRPDRPSATPTPKPSPTPARPSPTAGPRSAPAQSR